jgi:ABC-type transport system involved in multi-copper enzyme maturation permease subunit
MSLPLLRKEAHEHGAVLAATFAIALVALYVLLEAAAQTGGRFVGLARFLLTIAPILALVVANRLLVREYTGRTQFFLETLPIGRTRTFVSKWLLGCALLLLTAWLAWAATLAFVRRTEVLDSAAAHGALLCAVTFCFTVWSFAALAGMLGRYRYIVWGAVGLAALIATDVGGIPFFDLPVLKLLGAGMQMAVAMPARSAFVVALAIAAGCAAGAAALALTGSGAMASTLSRRMTAREVVFTVVAFLAVATVAFTLEPKPVRPPFDLVEGEQFRGKWVAVGVRPAATFDATAALALAKDIAADADALIDALHLDVHPPIFVLPQRGLDREVMQRAELGEADGIVLKVAIDAPRENVRMLVLHSLLTDATLDRGMKDDRHVLLDGLSSYWALRGDEHARELWWLRAAAVDEPLPPERLTAWSETSERLGDCKAVAVAYGVFDSLVARIGLDAALGLARGLFAKPPDDARVLFERRPAAALAAAGVDWDELAADAAAARDAARARHAAELALRPKVTASVDWHTTAARGTEIETTVTGAPRYAAYYRVLSPWTTDAGDMPRLDVIGSRGVLPLSPPRDARVLAAIEVDDPVLDCPDRVLAERLQLGASAR